MFGRNAPVYHVEVYPVSRITSEERADNCISRRKTETCRQPGITIVHLESNNDVAGIIYTRYLTPAINPDGYLQSGHGTSTYIHKSIRVQKTQDRNIERKKQKRETKRTSEKARERAGNKRT